MLLLLVVLLRLFFLRLLLASERMDGGGLLRSSFSHMDAESGLRDRLNPGSTIVPGPAPDFGFVRERALVGLTTGWPCDWVLGAPMQDV